MLDALARHRPAPGKVQGEQATTLPRSVKLNKSPLPLFFRNVAGHCNPVILAHLACVASDRRALWSPCDRAKLTYDMDTAMEAAALAASRQVVGGRCQGLHEQRMGGPPQEKPQAPGALCYLVGAQPRSPFADGRTRALRHV